MMGQVNNRSGCISPDTGYMVIRLLIQFLCFCPVSQFQNTWNGRENLKLELAIKTLPKLGLGDISGKGTIGPLMFIAPTAKDTIKVP